MKNSSPDVVVEYPTDSASLRRVASVVIGLAMASSAVFAGAQNVVDVVDPPVSLTKLARPEPSNLMNFVSDKSAAIALGKALFWDMQVGSDGKQACASCHFHAGADTRSRNQLSPGPNQNGHFAFGGPNYQLLAADFPFHQFANVNDRSSPVVRSNSVVASSQGVFREQFVSVMPGQAADSRMVFFDPVFNVGGINTRRVEPRQTPTVINAVFNLRNFWDGRAQAVFNGVNPFGNRDPDAKVWKADKALKHAKLAAIELNDSSLASQATAPPVSENEMSAIGRTFPDLGRKMLSLRPLAGQLVASDDSVLGSYRHSSGYGLSSTTYADMVRAAFLADWWGAATDVTVAGRSFAQMEANFGLFFGLALQVYQATLISDEAPFDKFDEGNASALSAEQLRGFGVFMSKGNCVACHKGAAFTGAAIPRSKQTERIESMIMGNGQLAVYDRGFYNIGVTKTSDDIGVGGNDPFGNPLSFSGVATQLGAGVFKRFELENPNVKVKKGDRIAVNGAFKTPTLRNVELTAPYFHNGGAATLAQVVEFYNRGGNFAQANIADLDPDIRPLGLSDVEKQDLVAFLKSLTDERVRIHAAPFDHPQLIVPNGHVGDTRSVQNDAGWGRAVDSPLTVPAVGRAGYPANQIPRPFLGLKQ